MPLNIFRHILDSILPTSCSYCHSPVGHSLIPYFCSSCWADFMPIQGPVCLRCARPFESPEALTHSPDHECSACRLRPPFFDQSVSVGYFEGSLREAIHQFKYRPCHALGKPLARRMTDNIRLLSDIDAVIPVPLHTKRLKQRGFNQALLLAHCFSEAFRIPLVFDQLVRERYTRPQVELSGEERIRNVAGAFALRNPDMQNGKRIALVDDVFTSGATLNECASVLKAAGASQVFTVTLARVV